MMARLLTLSLLIGTLLFGEFIEPNPVFLRSFWKTLPIEETVSPEAREEVNGVEKPGKPQHQLAEKRRFAPAPSAASRWFIALAAATFLYAFWEVLRLLRQGLFHIRLNSALTRGDTSKARFLLQRHLRLPPGTTMTEIAEKLDNHHLSDNILACEFAKFKKK